MDSMVKYGTKTFTKIVGINNTGANGKVLKGIETDIKADKSYFVVGDLCTILPEKIIILVIAVGIANGNETVAIRKADGTKWKAMDITTSSKIKHEWYPI